MDISIKLNFNSTLEGSVLTLTCENEISNFTMNATEEILSVTCDSNGSWIPNPADFIQSCSPFSTTGTDNNICWLLPIATKVILSKFPAIRGVHNTV